MIKIKKNLSDSRNTIKHPYYWLRCKCGVCVSRRVDSKAKYCLTPRCKYSHCINHGLTKTSLYRIWEGLVQRCCNPKDTSYHNYGARGITLCNKWRYSSYEFINWAKNNGWKKGLDIDRVKNNGNYDPNNCRFTTRSINNLNSRKCYRGNVTSEYIGIIKRTGIKRYYWDMSITYKGKSFKSHGFKTEIQAVIARDLIILKYELPATLQFPELIYNISV